MEEDMLRLQTKPIIRPSSLDAVRSRLNLLFFIIACLSVARQRRVNDKQLLRLGTKQKQKERYVGRYKVCEVTKGISR